MNCRRLSQKYGSRAIVWFGSCGAERIASSSKETKSDSGVITLQNSSSLETATNILLDNTAMFTDAALRTIELTVFSYVAVTVNRRCHAVIRGIKPDGTFVNLSEDTTPITGDTLSYSFYDGELEGLCLSLYSKLSPNLTVEYKLVENVPFYSAMFFNKDDIHDNYSSKQQGVVDSLTQRLSIIKNELWYSMNTGMPLLDKVKSRAVIDTYVVKTILEHPDVNEILNFSSSFVKESYTAKLKISTIYGIINIDI